MTNCKYCGKEIIQGEFEGQIDICTDCIIASSQDYGLKIVSAACIIFLIGLLFVLSILQLIFGFHLLILNFEEYISYYSIFIAVCIITGSFLVGYFYISKKKKSRLIATDNNNIISD